MNRSKMFNKNRQIRSAVSASAKQIHSFWLFFCKETEMSRIGKNEATFKFFFGLSFQLVTRFVCGTSGWNHFFLIVFVDVGTLISFALDRICGCGCWCAGFSPTKKKKKWIRHVKSMLLLILQKKNPPKRKTC